MGVTPRHQTPNPHSLISCESRLLRVRRSLPPQLYSSTLGASARVTLVSETCGVGAPTVVSFTVVPTAPRLPSASKGAHSRRCAGSVSACQTFSGEWRSSLTRMSVHFSPSFRTCAPLAGLGVYWSRSVTFFSLSFSFVLTDPWVEVAFESIYVSGPEPTERSQPGIHLLARIAGQLGELNEVAAGVLQHRNGRAG